MPDCETLREEWKAYLDGELSSTRRWTLRRHLARCAACREEIRIMERIGKELRAEEPEPLAPALRARILASLPEGPPPASPRPARRVSRRPLLLAGAAAGLLLAWVMASPLLQRAVRTGMPVSPLQEKKTVSSAPLSAGSEGAMERRMDDGQARYQSAANRAAGSLPAAVSSAPAAPGGRLASAPQGAAGEPAESARTGQTRNQAAEMKPQFIQKPPGDKTVTTGGLPAAVVSAPAAQGPARHEAVLTLEVQQIEQKRRDVVTLARSAGGLVAANRLESTDQGVRTASLVVRVPTGQLDSLVGRLAKLGTVKGGSVYGQGFARQAGIPGSQAQKPGGMQAQPKTQAGAADSSGGALREQEKRKYRQTPDRQSRQRAQAELATLGITLREQP